MPGWNPGATGIWVDSPLSGVGEGGVWAVGTGQWALEAVEGAAEDESVQPRGSERINREIRICFTPAMISTTNRVILFSKRSGWRSVRPKGQQTSDSRVA